MLFAGSLVAIVSALFLGATTQAHVWRGNDYKDGLLRKSMLSENRYPKEPLLGQVDGVSVQMLPSNASHHHIDVCDECKTVVQEISDILKDPQAVARYKRVVKMICLMATGHAAECEAFVESIDVFMESMQEMMKDPNKCCHQLHLCGDKPNVVSRIFLLALKGFNFEMKATQKEMPSVDILCDECLFMSNELAVVLSDPEYQKNLEDVVKKLCTIIPQVKAECQSTIDAYAPAIFQEILEYLANPRPFCQQIGFCRQASVRPLPIIYTSTSWDSENYFPPEERMAFQTASEEKPCPFAALNDENSPGVCLLCEVLTQVVLDNLKDERSLSAAENVAMSFCHSLPSEWTYPCVDWVSNYLSASVLSMLSDVSVSTVCKKMGTCLASDQVKLLTMSRPERQEAVCSACKTIATASREWLENGDYVTALENGLTRLCKKSPVSAMKKCYLTTEKYVKKLKSMASNVEKADELCYKLAVCKPDQIWWRR